MGDAMRTEVATDEARSLQAARRHAATTTTTSHCQKATDVPCTSTVASSLVAAYSRRPDNPGLLTASDRHALTPSVTHTRHRRQRGSEIHPPAHLHPGPPAQQQGPQSAHVMHAMDRAAPCAATCSNRGGAAPYAARPRGCRRGNALRVSALLKPASQRDTDTTCGCEVNLLECRRALPTHLGVQAD